MKCLKLVYVDENIVTVGVTSYAQDTLDHFGVINNKSIRGEIVYAELP